MRIPTDLLDQLQKEASQGWTTRLIEIAEEHYLYHLNSSLPVQDKRPYNRAYLQRSIRIPAELFDKLKADSPKGWSTHLVTIAEFYFQRKAG